MMSDTSEQQRFRVGIIGDPVAHSRSPALHNAAFRWAGIPARYEHWLTTVDDLPARIASLRTPDMLGANVTLPHKIAVLPLIDRVDHDAEVIGAVNTIVRESDGTLTGANTDCPAFLAALREDAPFEPHGQIALILGARGAARAAAVALVGAGIARLIVVNRSLDHAELLLGDVLAAADTDPQLFAITPDDPQVRELMQDVSLIVNATSVGWHDDETPLDAMLISPSALVYDMVYRPTRLLREAAARGARTCNGTGMLVRQAALAWQRWTGRTVPLDVMQAALQSD